MQISLKLTRQENARYHKVSPGSIVKLDIEEYLKGVLPAEIYESRTPMQAKYAQAVAARTYALRKALDGATISDTPNHQSYKATLTATSPNSCEAVERTRGMVLMYGGQVIQCYYSNSNGGTTKRTDEVWSAKLPYYQSRADPWDMAARSAAFAQGKTIKASHGVGLSQVGAEYAARLGKDFADILAFYYPGTTITQHQQEVECMSTTKGITGKQLAEFAIECLESGVRYWYGTYYRPCSMDLYERKKKQYPGHYGDSRERAYMEDIEAGAMCCDCVGLIKGAVWSELGTRDAKYATNGCPDKSANGMLEYCIDKGMEHGGMDSFPDEPGLLLHKDGHVGVSIGSERAIEARGFADDMVEEAVDGRGWTSWARLPFIVYEGNGVAVEPQKRDLGARTLRRGCKGEDVQELQLALVALGYDCGHYGENGDGVDGNFGYTTEAAVKAFQRDADVEIDGIYGPKTHEEMLIACVADEWPIVTEDGSPEGGNESVTYRVTVYGVDEETAHYLLEMYDGVMTVESGGVKA